MTDDFTKQISYSVDQIVNEGDQDPHIDPERFWQDAYGKVTKKHVAEAKIEYADQSELKFDSKTHSITETVIGPIGGNGEAKVREHIIPNQSEQDFETESASFSKAHGEPTIASSLLDGLINGQAAHVLTERDRLNSKTFTETSTIYLGDRASDDTTWLTSRHSHDGTSQPGHQDSQSYDFLAGNQQIRFGQDAEHPEVEQVSVTNTISNKGLKTEKKVEIQATNQVAIPTLTSRDSTEYNTRNYPKDSLTAKIYDQYSLAVGDIEASKPADKPGFTTTSYGSGYFVDEKGLMFTDLHAVSGFDTVTVTTANGKHTAHIVAKDEKNDLALLQVKPNESEKFPWLPLKKEDIVVQNQELLILGHADSPGKTFLRDGTVDGGTTAGQINPTLNPGEDPDRMLIAVNAHGRPGDSGGPAIDQYAEVVGTAAQASTPESTRGDHIYVTRLGAMKALLQNYQGDHP